jgi:hypothetical protein
MKRSNLGNPTTASESMFEDYLIVNGHTDWAHEQRSPDKATTPDYRLGFNGADLYFEVKEFENEDSVQVDGEDCARDPYRPLREKINQASRQFKHYKEFSCSLVFANPKFATVDLDMLDVFGAMLGDFGYRVEFGVPVGPDNPLVPVFTTGGKMVDRKHTTAQNTTFSSIIVLSYYPLRRKVRETELGRELTLAEEKDVHISRPVSERDPRMVAVYENPDSRVPLPESLFRGPFDQRWRKNGDHICSVYLGEELQRIETLWRVSMPS